MARKRHSDEDFLMLLRQIEVKLAGGSDVSTACRAASIAEAIPTYGEHRRQQIAALGGG